MKQCRLPIAVLTLLGVLALPCRAAAQQRPLITEDPEPIGAGRVLLEGGIDNAHGVEYPVSGLKGNLWRIPTVGISIGISSIAELQIDGGLYDKLSITERAYRAAQQSPDHGTDTTTHDVEDTVVATKIRLRRRNGRPARDRDALRNQAAERVERERSRPRHDRLLHVAARRQDRPVDSRRGQFRLRHPCRIRRSATARTTCWCTGCRSRGR